ncbi:GNAT family N-acetyltransferase [Calothrix sp. 336/3]|uniref:GNAT family N-acetyltransferase n=1 Tax=Calothrix sp. 336/3 TaxID=1337936 RepID=UPI0004E29C70|nr:GNAT family N-acetyltransferase [Calothrix sp. 336/3]AKG20147.1 GCN5 family acetyltransferase [Calothrix sp. 336/3]
MGQNNLSLPNDCLLRAAQPKDIWSIRWLVLSAKLDPTQLIWQQFTVIECAGKIIACGQLRNFTEAQELGSLVVKPHWQKQGLGSLLVEHLITSRRHPLYLECLGVNLTRFYSRFGFANIDFAELPASLKQKFSLSHKAQKLKILPVIYMKYRGDD